MKYFKKILSWLLLAIIILLGFFYYEFFTVASDSTEPVFIEIAPNTPFERVIPQLKEKNLIRNETLFEYLAEYTDQDTKVKAGRFRIEPTWTPARILNFLAKPDQSELLITIPEGSTIFDIDEKLAQMDLIKQGDFINWAKETNTAEGSLFPDTYYIFSRNFSPSDLGEKMLKNFQKKVIGGLKNDLAKSKRSLEEIIKMASILEKEAKHEEDYAVIAGILWKRFDHNWPLQADATLLYGKKDRMISRSDVAEDSEYNTYTRVGLPKTAISNPGLNTIKAALNPKDSPYWFYLTDESGRAVYARTNKEHEENKRRYL